MQIINKEKLSMCKEHIVEGKSLSHISERYNYKDIRRIKYWINLYKKQFPFIKLGTVLSSNGVLYATRTHDPLIKSQMLYQLS